MAHLRKVIRQTVRDLLLWKTEAEDRVFASREAPWRKLELPAIAVYALEEPTSASMDETRSHVLRRDLSLAILVVASVTDVIDDTIDDLAEAVEAVMHADPTLGLGETVDAVLTDTTIEIAEEQGRPVGVARLTYRVTYYTET